MISRPYMPLTSSPYTLGANDMMRSTWICLGLISLAAARFAGAADTSIPKPEHPRPDAMRAYWANLNGRWEFRFDAKDQGLNERWEKPDAPDSTAPSWSRSPGRASYREFTRPKGPPIGWYRRDSRTQKISRPISGSGSASRPSTGERCLGRGQEGRRA